MKKIFLIIILLLVFMQPIYALTASSENYSVARFGTGVQTTNMTSSDLTGKAVSLANAGTRNAENENFFTNIGFWANTSYHVTVSITSYSIYPISAVQGSIIKLSISALNPESVWAVLTLPSGSSETIALINNGDAYYTANSVGIYNVTFYANSSQGSLASVIDSFEITSPVVPPSTQGGNSGGGTSILIEKCTYIWDCSSWSICSDSNQTRECKNLGNCTGTEGKPIETRECSDALFDVVISFKEVGLNSDGTLRFNVNLRETKNVEKIDVQIRYSIIDNNNIEIFSQIETRAIQGNLTYEKAINEVKLINGDYTLRVDILYGNSQRAFAEQKFKVKDKRIEIELSAIQKIIESLSANLLLFIIILLLIIITLLLIVIILTIIIPKIKKISLKQKREQRKKNSIKQKIKRGLKLIGEGKITESRSIYENIKKTYNPHEDTNRKIYDKIIEFYNKIVKGRFSIFYPGIIGLFVLFLSKLNITGGVIGTGGIKTIKWVFALVVISVLAFLITLRYRNKKHLANSILGLINKKVYSAKGDYIGEVKDVILGKDKIESIKIEVDKKHNFKAGGMIIDYRHVSSVSEIMIIDEAVAFHLEKS